MPLTVKTQYYLLDHAHSKLKTHIIYKILLKIHLLGGKPVVRLSVLTKTLHQSVFWSVDGCYYTTLLSQPAGRCIRDHRAGGPQYFYIFKELLRKHVLCSPPPNIESLKWPPTKSQSCSVVPVHLPLLTWGYQMGCLGQICL